jgi:hypothetical protein
MGEHLQWEDNFQMVHTVMGTGGVGGFNLLREQFSNGSLFRAEEL